KCHGNTANNDIHNLVNDELNRLEQAFIKEANPAANFKLTKRFQQLRLELSSVFPEFLINIINIESHVYIEEPAHWVRFITEKSESTSRQQVKEIISQWTKPRYILARVTDVSEHNLTLVDELSGSTHQIHRADSTTPGEWLFGIAMPDPRQGVDGLIVKNASLFIPKADVQVRDALATKLQAGVTDAYELYKEFTLAKRESAIETPENAPAVELPEVKETPEETPEKTVVSDASSFSETVLALTEKYVHEFNLDAANFTTKLNDFLSNEIVKAKKAETVAASAILAGQATNDLPEGGLSKIKDVAEYFEVSSSSLAKYRKQITEFLEK
ncbi:MAG: hypothetical protein RR603_01595, partial [Kurthia sp.]